MGRDDGVGQQAGPAGAGTVQLQDREHAEGDPSSRPGGDGRVCKVTGEHGIGGGGAPEEQPSQGGGCRHKEGKLGRAAVEQPFPFQEEETEPISVHPVTSLESR